jgi:hypothetical protein
VILAGVAIMVTAPRENKNNQSDLQRVES